MPEYLIEAVGTPREWGNDYGQFFAYPLTLQGEAGEIEWSRKKESRAPVPGERIVGDITNGQHGRKIKVDFNATKELSGGSSGGSRSHGSKSKEWKPESQYDPEKTARITRSHAQKVAVEAAVGAGYFQGEITPAKLDDDLKPLIDWFEADVNNAAAKAAGAGVPISGGAAPAPAEIQSNAEYLSRLLEEAGFDSAAWPLVQRYIEETFDNDRRTKVEAALRDPAQRDRAKGVLIGEVEKWSGKPLPVANPDDEIPF
jgi:hypothetical protein